MTPTQVLPRRRWYHRFAVVETQHATGERVVVSWHMTRDGAHTQIRNLIAHYWNEDRGRYIEGRFEWVPVFHKHPYLREAYRA